MNSKKTKNKRITFGKFLKYFFLSLLIILIGFIIYFFQAIKMPPPIVEDMSFVKKEVMEIDTGLFGIEKNRFRKSESGLFELYVEGGPFERGVFNGKLAVDLVKKQEDAFVEEIKKMIPSEGFLKFLKYMTAWFNRNMDDYVPEEYLQEIYGISISASNDYEFIGSNYERILNYHAAHDIGHALQHLMQIGCTSFSAKGTKTQDGSLILGRNFDFYVGDTFAEDKIVTFYNPTEGYKFVEITWGGFIGTVSGMNDQGLTVTLNAGKSDIPFSSANPISLIAREILQYASTIEEAYKIAQKRDAFVAEAIMIGSANDNNTAIIEITPNDCSLFYPNSEIVIGPNHFQSDFFKDTELNLENITESSSMYRFNRMNELIKKHDTIGYIEAAEILRDRKGLNDSDIGMGNEKNICQLISHHAVIFKPDELKIWISTNPYQLGAFICYDLDSVFAKFPGMTENSEINENEFTVSKDPFIESLEFENFEFFRMKKEVIKQAIRNESSLNKEDLEIEEFIQSNPNYFYVYQLAGDYYFMREKYTIAKEFYDKALSKEITTPK
jgi:isopenicillin-N N-acyltransferase-like protein